jgi:hypothetical protein
MSSLAKKIENLREGTTQYAIRELARSIGQCGLSTDLAGGGASRCTAGDPLATSTDGRCSTERLQTGVKVFDAQHA